MVEELTTGQLVVRRLTGILDSGRIGLIIGRFDKETTIVMWTGDREPVFDYHRPDLLKVIDNTSTTLQEVVKRCLLGT